MQKTFEEIPDSTVNGPKVRFYEFAEFTLDGTERVLLLGDKQSDVAREICESRASSV